MSIPAYSAGLTHLAADRTSQRIEQSLAVSGSDKSYLDPHAIMSRIENYVQRGDYNAAIAECDSALTYYPDEPVLYLARGLCYEKLGEYEMAILDYEDAYDLFVAWGDMDEAQIVAQHMESLTG